MLQDGPQNKNSAKEAEGEEGLRAWAKDGQARSS
jgi:hypothetical protein